MAVTGARSVVEGSNTKVSPKKHIILPVSSMLPDCYQYSKVRQQLRTGEDVAQAFLDTYRSTWKLGKEPIPPSSHPDVLSRRPGILVAVKAGVSTKKYETPQVCVFEFRKIHVGIVWNG